MKNICHHALLRINERGNNVINRKNKFLVRNIKKNGINAFNYLEQFKNTVFSNYLRSKKQSYHTAIYLYLEYIFIFRKKILITFYPIPIKYLHEYFINSKLLKTRKILSALDKKENKTFKLGANNE